ncbi:MULTISPECIES: hypothetical protein [unclassified Streptomyces]|uniref:hypothetical protein n=1 Tax=unclassified Streptomyces TaxID=2593676 RepID=UPI00148778EC|nr:MULTISPECIES: hypothetical protein [unclassified Streptomyces]
MTDNPQLVHIGWYCWRCNGLVEQACRSDNVPVSVPADWADDMRAELRRLGEEDDTPAPAHDAGPTVREAAADDRRWPLEKHGE